MRMSGCWTRPRRGGTREVEKCMAMTGTIRTMMVIIQRPINRVRACIEVRHPRRGPLRGSLSIKSSVTNINTKNENKSRLTFLTTRDSREHHREREFQTTHAASYDCRTRRRAHP